MPLKILCCHGHRQDSEIFSQRLNRLSTRLKRIEGSSIELVFIDAPYELPLEDGQSVRMRSWTPPSSKDELADWSAAHRTIDAAISEDGDRIDGILGFSQGCSAVTSWLCSDNGKQNQVRFVILGCGSGNGMEPTKPNSILIPSLHITGDSDSLVSYEASMKLATYYDASMRQYIRHTQGHSISPNVNEDIVRFVLKHVAGYVTEDAAPQHQIEELEALEAIFEERYTLLRRNPPEVMVDLELEFSSDEAVDNEKAAVALDDGTVGIIFKLPTGYPEVESPSISFSGLGTVLSKCDGAMVAAARIALQDKLYELAKDELSGAEMLFTLVDEARDWLTENLPHFAQGKNSEGISENAMSVTASFEDNEAKHRAFILAATEEAAKADVSKGKVNVSKTGEWQFCVGLVGKPSAGKSTLYNTVTKTSDAKMAAFPFTTIEPNIGVGFYAADSPALSETMVPEPTYGNSLVGQRLEPTIVKDVAGLVPGAWKGLGKGNAFLNDLLDADVLIHVLDASGTTDKSGVKVVVEGSEDVGSGIVSDIGWVREEIHIWIYSNLARKWDSIRNRPEKFIRMFSGYHCKDEVVRAALERVGTSENDLAEELPTWSAEFLHRIVAHFLRIRFPILLALNKFDRPKAQEFAKQAYEAFPHDTFVPLSAKLEFILQTYESRGLIRQVYLPSVKKVTVEILSDSKEWANSSSKEQEAVLAAVKLHTDTTRFTMGSTGVLDVITKAVSLKPPLLAYPVDKVETMVSLPLAKGQPQVLSHAVSMYPDSTAEDLYKVLKYKGAISGDFVRAETVGPEAETNRFEARPIRKDEQLSCHSSKIFRILTNRKVQWQQQHKLPKNTP